MEQALECCEKILGLDHPNTKLVRQNLESVRNELEKDSGSAQ
ncbi:MAG: hypothetical protein C4531_08965 [Desulfurivibrio sp.]|nr:MAG: hypothetical protein C4531_08965 [Desulfurivibrio sp.]